MLGQFKEYIRTFSYLGAKEVASLIEMASIQSFNAGELVISAGDLHYNMYFILKGLFRTYVVKSNGEERTVYLASEGMVTGSSKAFTHGTPSTEVVTAIEKTWVATIDIRVFEKRIQDNAKLQRLYSDLMKQNLSEAIGRIEFHTVMSPQERYAYLVENRPELIQRVQQKHLASFLGITPVSLSRIRARMTGSRN